MSRAALKAQVTTARTALRLAEHALADSYGQPVQDLASAFRLMFSDGELRRFARSVCPGAEDHLPEGVSMVDLSRAVACLLADAGTSAATLRSALVEERPRRQQDIDRALTSWGGQ